MPEPLLPLTLHEVAPAPSTRHTLFSGWGDGTFLHGLRLLRDSGSFPALVVCESSLRTQRFRTTQDELLDHTVRIPKAPSPRQTQADVLVVGFASLHGYLETFRRTPPRAVLLDLVSPTPTHVRTRQGRAVAALRALAPPLWIEVLHRSLARDPAYAFVSGLQHAAQAAIEEQVRTGTLPGHPVPTPATDHRAPSD